ncbi:MAG: helix-turn-helix transcriptional regulator [Oscillochloris sp.]|nr:helix-turn-helix transcriptional regulator [Oscillochloris sp.]
MHPGVTHLFWAGAANDFLVADLNAAHVALPAALHTINPERRPIYLPLDARPAALFNALQAELALGGTDEGIIRDALARYTGAVVAAALTPRLEPTLAPARRIAQQTREYLEAHALTTFRIGTIAAAIGVSERHLQRSFQAHFGVSVLTYIQQIRLREACRLLSQTDLPIHAVAAAVGFESQSYFTRLFHRTIGCTPMHYRTQP